MLLTAGSIDIQKLIAGDAAGKKFAKIVVGTSDTPVTVADSALTNAFAKPIESVNYFTDGHIQFVITLQAADPAMVIKEVGLLDDNGVLLYRKVIPAQNKVAGATYVIDYKIKVQ